MIRKADFETTIYDVKLEVKATVEDGEIDEFTVYAGDVIITEIISDDVRDKLQHEVLQEVSDVTIELTKADDKWKEKE